MILEIKKEAPVGRYGRYFLSFEAPGDEEAPKRNTKVINIKPNNRSRTDFTDGADLDDEEILDTPMDTPMDNSIDTPVDTPLENPTVDAPVDQPAPEPTEDTQLDQPIDAPTDVPVDTPIDTPVDNMGGQTNEQIPVDTPIEDNNAVDTPVDQGAVDTPTDQPVADTPIDAPVDIPVDQPMDQPAEDNTQLSTDVDTPEDVPDEPITDDTTDFTDGADGTPDPETPEGGDQGSPQGPGLEYDSTRKYHLFKDFISLSNAIDNYIDKLENKLNDDTYNNKIIRDVVKKLKEIKELCVEYMMMKFEISSYIQSLLFFQNLVAMIKVSFNLLERLKKYQQLAIQDTTKKRKRKS